MIELYRVDCQMHCNVSRPTERHHYQDDNAKCRHVGKKKPRKVVCFEESNKINQTHSRSVTLPHTAS